MSQSELDNEKCIHVTWGRQMIIQKELRVRLEENSEHMSMKDEVKRNRVKKSRGEKDAHSDNLYLYAGNCY